VTCVGACGQAEEACLIRKTSRGSCPKPGSSQRCWTCGPTTGSCHRLVTRAESAVRQSLRGRRVEDLPHVAAWRDAYRAFGAKPQRTRNSLEALMRRAESGLPRVNRLTDIYNALSVLHQVPIGGEDLSRYFGSPRLARATGDES